MALYRYIAKTKDGRTIKEVIDAGTREELVNNLRAKNLFVLSIVDLEKEKTKGLAGKFTLFKRNRKHGGIKASDMCYLARNLSITLSSGVPLLRSLEIISLQVESLGLSRILDNIKEDVRKGLSLSESIEKYPRVFSSLWQGIVEVGEASGNLPFVLDKLANYLEMRIEFERKIKSALIYPTIVCVFGFIAVTVFFKFVLPRFTSIFEQFDIELPFLTKILVNISNFFNRYFFTIIGVLMVFIVTFFQLRKKRFGKKFIDRINLILPLISDFIYLVGAERFASTMYILLESGVPIIYTLEVIGKSIGNVVLENAIFIIRDNVKKGKNLSQEIARVGIFPPLVSEIAKIGEETGNMPEMFRKLSEHYRKELDTKMERIIALFEPLIIILLGIGIGTIVIALFLPVFKLSTLGA